MSMSGPKKAIAWVLDLFVKFIPTFSMNSYNALPPDVRIRAETRNNETHRVNGMRDGLELHAKFKYSAQNHHNRSLSSAQPEPAFGTWKLTRLERIYLSTLDYICTPSVDFVPCPSFVHEKSFLKFNDSEVRFNLCPRCNDRCFPLFVSLVPANSSLCFAAFRNLYGHHRTRIIFPM